MTQQHQFNLPAELLHEILLKSLPPPAFQSWTERSQILRSWSLVNSVCRTWAQRELLINPVVKDFARDSYLPRTNALCAALDEAGAVTANKIKTLRVTGYIESSRFKRILQRLIGLEELRMVDVFLDDVSCLSFASPTLVRVSATSCELRSLDWNTENMDDLALPMRLDTTATAHNTPFFILPNVRHLHLEKTVLDIPAHPVKFIDKASFPSVTSFFNELSNIHCPSEPFLEDDYDVGALDSSQLHAVATPTLYWHEHENRFDATTARNIHIFQCSLATFQYWPEINLPPSTEILLLTNFDEDALKEVIENAVLMQDGGPLQFEDECITNVIPAIEQLLHLRQIYVPSTWPGQPDFEAAFRWGQGRGIEVVYVNEAEEALREGFEGVFWRVVREMEEQESSQTVREVVSEE